MSKPYIKLLDIYYGAKCNLACNQCDTRSDIIRDTDSDPSLDSVLEGITLAQQQFEIDLYSVLGGEPLLYLDKIDAIISHIRKTDPTAKIQFSTNGALLLKKADELAELMTKHSTSLFVCNHFAGFDPIKTKNIAQGVDKLVKLLGMTEGNADKFFQDFIDFSNPRNDPYMAEWIKANEETFPREEPEEQYFHNDSIFVHFRPQYDFKKNHYMLDGKPKPFKTGDPALSYRSGCSSVMCSFLIDSSLYKCAALGTLDKLLTFYDSTEDPDWQKYLSYKPLDLKNCTSEEVVKFSNTKYSCIEQCDMCGVDNFMKSKETVIHVHRR
jgi:organic radical activating enzyme